MSDMGGGVKKTGFLFALFIVRFSNCRGTYRLGRVEEFDDRKTGTLSFDGCIPKDFVINARW